jgi:hypothetical protein
MNILYGKNANEGRSAEVNTKLSLLNPHRETAGERKRRLRSPHNRNDGIYRALLVTVISTTKCFS